MIDEKLQQIRAAIDSVLSLIKEHFGEEHAYYLLLNNKQYKPRVIYLKALPEVQNLRAYFYGRDNHRAFNICDEYLKIAKQESDQHNDTIKQANEILCESAKYDPLNFIYKEHLNNDNVTHFL